VGHSSEGAPISEMLSCDLRLALCTFMQLVCLALPCPFVSVMWAPMSNRSGRSFEGIRVDSFGLVIRARSFDGGLFEGVRVNSFGRVV